MVQFLARVEEQFGVELPIDVLFASGFTVAEASKAIDQGRIAAVDDDELAAPLKQLDGMSDDEINELLSDAPRILARPEHVPPAQPRRGEQVQPDHDGAARGARPRVPCGGADERRTAGHLDRRSRDVPEGAAAPRSPRPPPTSWSYRYNGVQAHVVTRASLAGPADRRRRRLEAKPDWTLVPSDDPGLIVLGAALKATPERVVYLAHTLQQLPFGPGAFYPSAAGTRMGEAGGVGRGGEPRRRGRISRRGARSRPR